MKRLDQVESSLPPKSPQTWFAAEWEKKTESQLSNGNDGGEEEDYSKWNGMTQRSDSSVRASDKIIFFCEKVSCRFFGVLLLEKWYSESFLIYCLRAARTHNRNRPTMKKKSWNSSWVNRKSSKMCWIAIASALHLPTPSGISRSAIGDREKATAKLIDCLTHWTFHLIKVLNARKSEKTASLLWIADCPWQLFT